MNRVSSRGGEASQQHEQQSTDDFLQTVCVQIRAKTAHRQVRRELEGHIQDVIEELTSEGMSPEEAERIAVERMGDPRDIGRQLNQVHKPVIEWGMIGLACWR
ncbi:permease prefix domain 1-containing protein [Paenibacillus sp. 1P07SE]|uniref:permease prefix domain 1-containing protein n=1 Tax=Paenibacillus sp. 1P07SE TaxID=3132209 RepID=UPI0039A6E216